MILPGMREILTKEVNFVVMIRIFSTHPPPHKVGRDQAWEKEKHIQKHKVMKTWWFLGDMIKAYLGQIAKVQRNDGERA